MGSFGRHFTRTNSRTNVLVSALPPTIGGSACRSLSFKDKDEKLSVARSRFTPLPDGSGTSPGKDADCWAANGRERIDSHTATKPMLEKGRMLIISRISLKEGNPHSAISTK